MAFLAQGQGRHNDAMHFLPSAAVKNALAAELHLQIRAEIVCLCSTLSIKSLLPLVFQCHSDNPA